MTFKKLISLGLCLLMLLSLVVGCGDESNTEKESTIAEIMKAAQEKIADAKSMSFDMNMDLEMNAEGESVNMAVNCKGDYIVDPLAMSIDMTMSTGDLGNMDMKMYMQQKDGAYMMYTGVDIGTGTLTWSSQKLDNIDSLNQYNAQASMDMYLSCADSFVEKGTETINGSEATRYDGIISSDSLEKAFDSSGVLGQLSGLGINDSTMKSTLKDLGDLPISIWVEKDSGLPIQYDMDMTDMIKKMLTEITENADNSEEVSISKMTMRMTITDVDNVENILIPEEALNSAS